MRWPRLSRSATATAFALPAAAVILVSLLLTLRQADANPGPDPPRFSGSVVVQQMSSLLPAGRLGKPVKVVVVRDEAAAAFYDAPATLDSIVARWRGALTAVGAEARIVSSGALAGARDAQVLVIPSSPCLSIGTHEAIAYAKAHGQGLIVTGVAGTQDAACREIGYGFIVGVTGALRAAAVRDRQMVYVTIPSGGPLAVDVPPGARLDLKPAGQIALRVPGRDAFYSDYALQPLPAQDLPLLDGAMMHELSGRARVVYWGFDLGDAAALPWNREILRLLVRNSVAWAAGEASSEVEPWPRGAHAAAALAQDVESGFANAAFILDSLQAAHVHSSFFVTSQLAADHSELSHRLAMAGEVGTHTENHRLLGGLPAEVQRTRLALTQHQLIALLGRPVRGLRPPEEQFDRNTMAAWAASGGTYLFGANDSRSAAPELLAVGGDTVVLIGRAGADDFAVLSADQGQGTDSVAVTFLDEFERFRALGGLYVLSYHSQLLGRPELLGALARTARTLASDRDVWLATTGQIADWWRQRAQLSTRLSTRPDGRIVAVVQNTGEAPVAHAVLHVWFPKAGVAASATASLLSSTDGSARLALPVIQPHATRTFTITLAGARTVSRTPARRTVRRSRPRRANSGWRRWIPWP
ncbi:MAG TPA: polysaccharide deacetylase family protein [Gemmatimonadaceae bacterium]|nr:polysaccharide deacetylase family protein [Gemmatimonadaceae bacterium]